MENELISIIVPAYNMEKYLPECLDSILNQTYQNLEIIVINDGSTDLTGDVIDKYEELDNRIVTVHQKNMGLVRGREVGISIAHGDIIGFVDADDTIEADMLERLYNNMKKYAADISHCGVKFCWPDGKIEPHYGTGQIIVQNNVEGQIELLSGIRVEPAVWNKLYRKAILVNSCLDLDVLNNEDLLRNFIAFKRAEKTVFEDFCGYNYFQRQGSMSKDVTKAVIAEKHVTRARQLIKENCENPEVMPYAIRLWIGSAVNSVNHLYRNDSIEAREYCKECSNFLKENQEYIRYLSMKQQIAARLIVTSSLLHKIVYGIYDRR